ncbi:MAG TPA: hypothetical protein DDW52_22070 [Planctomycetaceae bacterium]|nr:hypothetical protein [Planctomycetaceae bacterium]
MTDPDSKRTTSISSVFREPLPMTTIRTLSACRDCLTFGFTSRHPRNRFARSFAAALALIMVFSLLPIGTLQAQDRIFPADDATAIGKITSRTPDEIRIDVRGKEQVYPVAEVLKVVFDGEPRGLDRARDFVLQEQYDQAIDELKKINPAELNSDAVKEDFSFYVSYCRAKLGMLGKDDPAAAVPPLLRIIRNNPNTHHAHAINSTVGQLAALLGRDPTSFYAKLASARAASVRAEGAWLLGRYNLYAGQVAKARSAFETVTKLSDTSEKTQKYKRLCEVNLARCDIDKGNPLAVLDTLGKLATKYDSSEQELFAHLSNARGACYQKLGKPDQALVRFLQTDLMFFTAPQPHAEALSELSGLWKQAGEPSRAADARKRLQELYPSSQFAKQN